MRFITAGADARYQMVRRRIMSRAMRNHRFCFRAFLLVAMLVFGIPAAAAFAESGGFYMGLSGDVVRSGFEHGKTVDNTDVPDNYLLKGKSYTETDTMNKTGFGGRLFAGYRFNLDPSGTAYLAIEADGAVDSGEPTGMLEGKGPSDKKNQPGELWPTKLTVERRFNYGASVLLGASPEVLTSFMGSGSGLYILGGVQRLHTKLTTDYSGCPFFDRLCTEESEFTSGSASYDKALFGWTFGGGLEKMVGERTGIFFQVRHTRYGKKEWKGFEDQEGPDISLSLDGDETTFSLGTFFRF